MEISWRIYIKSEEKELKLSEPINENEPMQTKKRTVLLRITVNYKQKKPTNTQLSLLYTKGKNKKRKKQEREIDDCY